VLHSRFQASPATCLSGEAVTGSILGYLETSRGLDGRMDNFRPLRQAADICQSANPNVPENLENV
jgi:hypothetical protein